MMSEKCVPMYIHHVALVVIVCVHVDVVCYRCDSASGFEEDR